MSTFADLTLTSSLRELPLHDFRVQPTVTGQAIAEQFDRYPALPGVILEDEGGILGMISRIRFHERMTSRYSLDLFLKRPIQAFWELNEKQLSFLELPSTEKIAQAAQICLNRPPQDVYEPIVVVSQNRVGTSQYSLLDFHTLISAQSQILSLINHELEKQQSEIVLHLQALEQEQQKASEYTHLLERQQQEIQARNQQLERQELEQIKQAREISELNQRFLQIGQLLSDEGKKAFQATFAGVNVICRNTDAIVEIGRLLSHDLSTIYSTSQIIEKVSQQVRHLSVQAAIVANRGGTEKGDFSHVTTEIGQLITQTVEAGRQIDRVADRFKGRIQELTKAAQAGTVEARSLVKKIEQAQIALNALEALVEGQKPISEANLTEVWEAESVDKTGIAPPESLPLSLAGSSVAANELSSPLHFAPRVGDESLTNQEVADVQEDVQEEDMAEVIEKIFMAENALTELKALLELKELMHSHQSEPLIQKLRALLNKNSVNAKIKKNFA